MKNVLVACEESQRVCKAFLERGFNAYSCDIQKPSGGRPDRHILGDVIPLLNGKCAFSTMDGTRHLFPHKWDLIIAHPPCTYLTVTGNRWFNIEKYGDKARERWNKREEAMVFFRYFVEADCEHIAIENPVGVMSTYYQKLTQIIQPYWFGDKYEKKTCLWLKGLPKLEKTKEVEPLERIKFKSGKTMPKWYAEMWKLPKEQRERERSKTFQGIANAMAEQWGDFINE